MLRHLILFLVCLQLCSSQVQQLFDADSPLGNRLGFADTEHTRHERISSLTREARQVKRNSKGHRVLSSSNNGTVSLAVGKQGRDAGEMGSNGRRRLQGVEYPTIVSSLPLHSDLNLFIDPPDKSFSPCALGLFVRSNKDTANIYYEFEDVYTQIVPEPSLASAFTTWNAPYIHMATPFGATRNRSVTIVAVWFDYTQQKLVRSNSMALRYVVEADARPLAYGYLVPGVESSSYFLKFVIEMKAAARAQVAGGQEFADFNTELGVGTYLGQVIPMRLLDLHPDLNGFEGGFTVNCSETTRHFGILIPFHNGAKFVGKVVKIDISEKMDDVAACMANYRMETMVSGSVVVTGPGTAADACVHILDLPSLHPNARGFRRGFHQFPYAYLSPGEFNVPVRCDVCNFGLATTKILDMGLVDKKYGGYSGGFVDHLWSCFNPFRSYSGPFGGVRSTEPVDQGHLLTYFQSEMLCIHRDGWEGGNGPLVDHIRVMDFSRVDVDLRGFSEAVRVGRFCYLTPFATQPHIYAGKVVRLFLGAESIGDTLDYLAATGGKLRDIVDTLNLQILNPQLAGFSGCFVSGKFLFLVPFRNKVELFNGQRGHGNLVRIDMNDFDVGGIVPLDLTNTIRSQIPSFADEDLRGFSGGFASGKYGVLVPFFNAVFSGKVARFIAITDDMTGNVQELNLMQNVENPDVYCGYRGGFVSLWKGVYDIEN